MKIAQRDQPLNDNHRVLTNDPMILASEVNRNKGNTAKGSWIDW